MPIIPLIICSPDCRNLQNSSDKHIGNILFFLSFPKENTQIPFRLLLFLFLYVGHDIVFQKNLFLSLYVTYLAYVFRQDQFFAHTPITPFHSAAILPYHILYAEFSVSWTKSKKISCIFFFVHG